MRIPSGKTDQFIYFVAVDSLDLKTRETGLTSFTVYRSRKGGTATVYTTPTVAELSTSNMPGVYSLLIDEDTTIDSGSDSEEYVVHIIQASMAPVTRTIELYRRDVTSGQTALVDANGRVDVIKVAGTTQTARDIGASVLLSSGTGIGQLDFSSGVIKANLVQILATVLTETAGQLAAAFKKFFDKASPTGTINSLPDAVSGAAGGLLVDDVWTDARAAKLDNLDTTISSRGTGVALDAAEIRSSVGLASASLDSQLGAIDDFLDTEVAAIKAIIDSIAYKKNTALSNFEFAATDSTNHTAKTGLINGDFTKEVSIDGSAFTGLSETITEVANGVYKINLTAGELNGDVITLRFAASGMDDVLITIVTNG